MAASTYVGINSFCHQTLGIVHDVDATISTDQVINLNTGGSKWVLTNAAANNSMTLLNYAGTSLSTVTGAQVWSGASKTGTQYFNAVNLTGTAYRNVTMDPNDTNFKILQTITTCYYSCTSTTAGAGAKFNLYFQGLVLPY